MTEIEEEEEENNRILAHGNEEEEKNYETNGMNLKEILTQRLEGRVGGPTRRSAKGGWTPAEDDVLRRAVAIYKGRTGRRLRNTSKRTKAWRKERTCSVYTGGKKF